MKISDYRRIAGYIIVLVRRGCIPRGVYEIAPLVPVKNQ